MIAEIDEIFVDELPCEPEELPTYLVKILLDPDVDDDEKYSAIERFTIVIEGSADTIEWPEEGLTEEEHVEAEAEWFRDNK